MRRRRARGTWMPVNPTVVDADGVQTYVTYYDTFNSWNDGVGPGADWSPPGGPFTTNGTVAIPCTLDATPDVGDPTLDQQTLADYVQGQEWMCQRIVGKVWAALGQGEAGSEPPFQNNATKIIMAMALCVLPFQNGADGPEPAINNREYDPLLAGNAQQPFMWRRTWILANLLIPPPAGGQFFNYPTSTANNSGGGTFDGGHVDCKVKRRVRREERLCIVANARLLETNQSNGNEEYQFVNWGFDFRMFGGMRRARNNSSFK